MLVVVQSGKLSLSVTSLTLNKVWALFEFELFFNSFWWRYSIVYLLSFRLKPILEDFATIKDFEKKPFVSGLSACSMWAFSDSPPPSQVWKPKELSTLKYFSWYTIFSSVTLSIFKHSFIIRTPSRSSAWKILSPFPSIPVEDLQSVHCVRD